jgi:single-strand DNA-binding protein
MLIGNLTRDPNLRFTPNGTAVCSFGLATNRTWTPSDGGEKQEKVEYHNVVAWGKLADICGNLLHKGDKTFVEGRLQTRDWKTEDGQERRITEIVIDNMMLLSQGRGRSMQNDEGNGGYQSNSTSSSSNQDDMGDDASPSDVSSVEDVADDIPF